jgi:hypothetical protein
MALAYLCNRGCILFTEESTHQLVFTYRDQTSLLWLDGDTVNTVSVERTPDTVRNRHVILSGLYQHMDTSDDGRFG